MMAFDFSSSSRTGFARLTLLILAVFPSKRKGFGSGTWKPRSICSALREKTVRKSRRSDRVRNSHQWEGFEIRGHREKILRKTLNFAFHALLRLQKGKLTAEYFVRRALWCNINIATAQALEL